MNLLCSLDIHRYGRLEGRGDSWTGIKFVRVCERCGQENR